MSYKKPKNIHRKRIYLPLIVILLSVACGSNQQQTQPAANTEKQTTTETTTATTPPANEENANVSFKVNDTLVRTNKTTGGDVDEHIGIYTEAVKSLSFTLMGDVPNKPHRGTLEFQIQGFKFEPGNYTITKDNYASFRRYETINAGGPTEFVANSFDNNKGTEMNLSITKIEKDPNSFNGRDWLASGSFSAKMLIREDNPYKRTSTQGLTITEGSFKDIRIAGGPK